YTLLQALERLAPQIATASSELDKLPPDACPNDMAVALFTLNPSYIARSFFPNALLQAAGLASVGSRSVKNKPERWTRKTVPQECLTTQLFVAGKRRNFRELNALAASFDVFSHEADDFTHIEKVAPFIPRERIVSAGNEKDKFFEIGIHLMPEDDRQTVARAFSDYAHSLDAEVFDKLGFLVGTLWFVPVKIAHSRLDKLSKFSFIRVIRPVPKLRGFRPSPRSAGITIPCNLPAAQPLPTAPIVAILDGGLPPRHTAAPWVRSYKLMDPAAKDAPDGTDHGLAVTSAFLFGPIPPKGGAARPFAPVDHLRVLDDDSSTEDPLELYRTLGFIEEILLSRQYQFINLSLGPDLAIEDTDVHAWTSVIDDLLSDGDTLMTVAIGNNGERDRQSGNARVQVPGDCVNALCTGATDSTKSGWKRAPYSAIGPGRSPGVIKPDLVAFGGDPAEYFHVLTPAKTAELVPQMGTSFASPYMLRSAVGARAILGSDLTPLAIKALLIHAANHAGHDKAEVGWGKIPEDVMEIITCPAGVARIVYQGELKPGKYLRASLPLPDGGLTGMIKLKATFCYACPTDPQDAACYTRAGLDVTFRPHDGKSDEGSANADTKGFFSKKQYATEAELRADSGKWETVLHNAKNMRGSSLRNPVFDIHYNAREGGASTRSADKIRYALIISVEAPKHADLYNDILRAYAKTLVPLQPQVSLPIRIN
ncbi:MAG: S8 family peptidase, partial [Rariglobus sp.]